MTRVYLHIGAPKTGTTYLQKALFGNRARLRAAGVLYPGDGADAHFRATLDLRDLKFGGYDDPAVHGAWQRLVEAVHAWEGESVVVSHELLAGSPPESIGRLVDDLEHGGANELHVVLTARDLGRQVPAVWQEMVKNDRRLSYARYLRQVTSEDRSGRGGKLFWRLQHAGDVLARWEARVPADRIHLVTVPPTGAPSSVLWERFCTVIGVDPAAYTVDEPPTNTSLGFAEAELVRRVNKALDGRLDWPDYAKLVKGGLSRQLAARPGSPSAQVPKRLRGWFAANAAAMVEDVAARGYDVVGDLADLAPAYQGRGRPSPDQKQVAGAAADLLAEQVLRQAGHGRRGVRLASVISARLPGRLRRRARRLLPARGPR